MFNGLDHIAIVVPDTEEALKIWRDRFGFIVLYSELVNDQTVKLTHIDMGNAQLQLVEPVAKNHPLHDYLYKHGPGLHHICLSVDDIGSTLMQLENQQLKPGEPVPHQGTLGKRAIFLDKNTTGHVQVELTGK
jgi:methylmalonyl-CoA/ethylmalonyl-CoA epimerase